MKILKEILNSVTILQIVGNLDRKVACLELDSRKIKPNYLFFAQKGLLTDGHQFIENAIEKGATVVVCEIMPTQLNSDVTYVLVEHSNSTIAQVASNFYDNPSSRLKLIGVTGTNGKTTIATLLSQLFKNAGYKTGLLSTIKILVNNQEFPATHTTPNSIQINYFLSEMVKEGVDYCFMEVSSHGIHQNRTDGLQFEGGIFTNLTHDHLDYHKSFVEYRNVKKSFFDNLAKTAFALVNNDDKNGFFMLQNTLAKKYTYALKSYADFSSKILENRFGGLILKINNHEVYTKLIGNFNAYNLTAIYATAILLGLTEQETLTHLSDLESVSGRFQYLVSKDGVTAVIDYAHTPDALQNVLQTLNDIKKNNEEIITVVGCGGNRDKAKRPVMGRIASQLSNHIIFTSDNPRNEDPQIIINEMEAGVAQKNLKKIISILDREQAIKTAVKIAKRGSIILLAGKGHETYQEVNGIKNHFDDYEKIIKYLN